MNKKTKGLIAGVAGGALLLGTAGTFTLWTAADSVPAEVQSGKLSVAFDGEGIRWRDVTNVPGKEGIWGAAAKWNSAPEIGDSGIVPGDTLVGMIPVKTELKGENLEATVTVGGPDGETFVNVDTLIVRTGDGGVGQNIAHPKFTLTSENDGPSKLFVKVHFPGGEHLGTVESAAQMETAVLKGDITVTLKQKQSSSTTP